MTLQSPPLGNLDPPTRVRARHRSPASIAPVIAVLSGESELATAPTAQTISRPAIIVLGALASLLCFEIGTTLLLTHGHLVYGLSAAYVHLALAQEIAQGHYGLAAGEASAPASSILYPFLLAALKPFGTLASVVINVTALLAAGVFGVKLADEVGLKLCALKSTQLFVLAIAIALALNLGGLAMTGLEHSLHVALTVAYLLGLVRFVRSGTWDWWWFACIVIQPVVRFEGAGLLFADVAIFLALRKYGYAAATVLIGAGLVVGYSLFLRAIGLEALPSSVLTRSDWSSAAVASHSGLMPVVTSIAHNFYSNLNEFGAAQILGTLALGLVGVTIAGDLDVGTLRDIRKLNRSTRTKIITVLFMAFVSFAQLAGGKLGWHPPRYEAYVLTLNLCGLAIIFREKIASWCEHATWPGIAIFCSALLLVFAGYATQTFVAPELSRKEYLGAYQMRRFAVDFYHGPVAVDEPGYVNYRNPQYVLDLSGLASDTAREARAGNRPVVWMDDLLAEHGIGVAIINVNDDPVVPAAWTPVAELRLVHGPETADRFVFYARRKEDIAGLMAALRPFAATLPKGAELITARHVKRIAIATA